MRFYLSLLISIFVLSLSLQAGDSPISTQIIAYKEIAPNESLVLKRYGPSGQADSDALPCALFIFGGGWNGGDIGHFSDQAEHLARRGMVAICAQYRTYTSHNVPPNVCLVDAKSAVRYVRANAEKLGIDPNRLAVGGGSAGGHLAAASTFCDGFNDPKDKNKKVDTRANALLLFNPVIDNGPGGYGHDRVEEFWKAFSPLHNINAPAPPTMFLLGDSDRLIPAETGHAFKRAIENADGRCDLTIYEQAEHGFFNKGRPSKNGVEYYSQTLQALDDFLVDLGYLKAR